ncbi:MAG: hypothetical protein LBG72_02160 [Spirochaetaceae bacterium]|jgi:hypothetical protein|nr:hypothetical protein [Spirochaetaceae bacterium]
MNRKNYIWALGILFASLCAALTACVDINDVDGTTPAVPTVNITIDAKKLRDGNEIGENAGVYEFPPDSAANVSLNNLDNNQVVFVHLNLSGGRIEARPVSSWKTSADSSSNRTLLQPGQDAAQAYQPEVTRMEYMPARNFTPPEGIAALPAQRRSLTARTALTENDYTVDDSKKTFWVQTSKWYEIEATLRYKSEFCFVWVADENYDSAGNGEFDDNKITSSQAFTLGEKFNTIYEKETAILGYEPGGGPDGDGGIDGLKPVQIFVYDIDADYKKTQTGGVLGYFWAKDLYTQTFWNSNNNGYKSNEAEIFYLDCHILDKFPSYQYSTLIHEFQHMINFNQKYKLADKSSATWYDEMMSMLAEDLIDEFIDIPLDNGGHPVMGRIPLFLSEYSKSGVNEWVSDRIISYSTAYAFGAFLVRNFGGPELLKEMMNNGEVDEKSVVNAVNTLTGGKWTFNELLVKYPEAFVFNLQNDKHYTFNKTVSANINGIDYTYKAFDITTITRSTRASGKGQYFYPSSDEFSVRPNAFLAVSNSQWESISGNMTLNLQQPLKDTRVFLILK